MLAACPALALAACGGHGAFTTASKAASGGASAGRGGAGPGSASPPSLSREQSFAHAVNLTGADLPGFRPAPDAKERETPGQRQLEQRFLACVGGGERAGAGREQRSGQYRRQLGLVDETVSSAVSFLREPGQAAGEVALLRSARTGRCLVRYLDERYRGQRFGSVVVGHVTISQGIPPAPGTSGGFAWRIDAPLRVRGVSVPFYMDMLGFVYRQAEVRLVSSGLIVPFPAAAQEQLFRLLLSRATAQKL